MIQSEKKRKNQTICITKERTFSNGACWRNWTTTQA